MATEIVLTSKKYCDFLKTLPWWSGGTKYRASLPYNCLYLATNNILWADCNNLVKSTIWGKATIPAKGTNWYKPGLYGLDDLTCEQLINSCSDISTDFSKLVPGECLYIKGSNGIDHIGTYVGDFSFQWDNRTWYCNVIEATAGFESGIIATYVDANGNRFNGKGGAAGGKWHKHGKLTKWIDYGDQNKDLTYTVKAEKNTAVIDFNGVGTVTITVK